MIAQPIAVLVHGILDDGAIFAPLQRRLIAAGVDAKAISMKPPGGWQGIEPLARQLAAFVEMLNAPKVDLVGFSMGGIVCRYFLQRLDGLECVRQLVTISSPHAGTLTGHLVPFGAAHQMRTGSKFLAELNSDMHVLEPLKPLSIWSRYDLTVTPANTAVLPVGLCTEIPVLLHRWMPRDARVGKAVVDHLWS
ncbi:MAG: alpha/beta fold hydrolase [Pseudomonadota bacterium]